MPTVDTDERALILIELSPRSGLRQVTRSTEDLAELSAKALDSAKSTVKNMAEWISTTIDDLAGNPDEVSIEFGIKLDLEGQALIAKARAEAAINIKLTWKREDAGGK